MSEPILWKSSPGDPDRKRYGGDHAVLMWVEPVEPPDAIEGRVWKSEPIDGGLHGYRITIITDRPANSLTMHNRVWLIEAASPLYRSDEGHMREVTDDSMG